MELNKIIVDSAKVAGGLMVFFGLVTVFGIIHPSSKVDTKGFSIGLVVGPTLIYLGLKLLNLN